MLLIKTTNDGAPPLFDSLAVRGVHNEPTKLQMGLGLKLLPIKGSNFIEPLHNVVKWASRIFFYLMKPLHKLMARFFNTWLRIIMFQSKRLVTLEYQLCKQAPPWDQILIKGALR